MPPILSFVGYSNSGKTALIKEVVKQLSGKNIKVGVIKHHHQLLNIPSNKDTTIFLKGGAKKVALVAKNGYQLTVLDYEDLLINTVLSEFKDMDLIIVEGYKNQGFLKIEVMGFGYSRLNIPENDLVALVSDEKIEAQIPVFKRNDINSLVDFIQTYYLK